MRLAACLGLAVVAAGAAQAKDGCGGAAAPERVDSLVRHLAATEGTGTHPIGAFSDGETIFVLLPRGPAMVVPPDIAALYRGRIAAESATVLMFAAPPAKTAAQGEPDVWRLEQAGVIVVPRVTVTETAAFAHGGRSYVFLAGEGGQAATGCLAHDVALLPSRGGIAVRTLTAAKTTQIGSEAIVEAGATTVLVSPCCTERPTAREIDSRRILDASTFTAHVEGARFDRPGGWRANWAAAALDAHERLRLGDLDEARAALADIRRRHNDTVSPAVVLLHELLQIDRPAVGVAPAAGPDPSVREERARLRTAHAVIAACRSRDFSALRRQRLAFVEVLPPPEALPPPLAARLALCEAEYLLQIGEARAAVARLRGPDAPSEGAAALYRLVLDVAALRGAGQAELAAFAVTRLAEALDDPAGPVDLRPFHAYLTAGPGLDPALVLRVVLDRQRSFGEYRLDFRLLTGALAKTGIGELVPRLDALRAFAARAPEPALSLAIHRLAARRLAEALAGADPDAATRPLLTLDFVRQTSRRVELADLARDLALAQCDLALQAGLDAEARKILTELLTGWPAGEPVDVGRRDWLGRLLRRQMSLAAAPGTTAFDEPLWQARLANETVAAIRNSVRRELEHEAVVHAVAAKEAQDGVPPAERRLFERLRNLRLDP